MDRMNSGSGSAVMTTPLYTAVAITTLLYVSTIIYDST